MKVFNVGLACCAMEFSSAAMQDVVSVVPGPAASHVLVISGTVTDKMAPLVRKLYDEMPEPRYVISFGACSNTGGPYWDSYCVTKGVDQLVPVDVFVPGCPPRPDALADGLAILQSRLDAA